MSLAQVAPGLSRLSNGIEKPFIEFTVRFIESKLPSFRWCAYSKKFLAISDFSAMQKVAQPENRYSMNFSDARQRAKKKPEKSPSAEEVMRMAAMMSRPKYIVIDVPGARNHFGPPPPPASKSTSAAILAQMYPRHKRISPSKPTQNPWSRSK